MTARRKPVIEPADPVELDQPDPTLTRWRALAEREIAIQHGGNAEKVMPMPRPSWSEPDQDTIGRCLGTSYYVSEPVHVATRNRYGAVYEDRLIPARFTVRAKLCGDGAPIVGLAHRCVVDGEWESFSGVGLEPAEAVELAAALLAAVDLLGEDGVPQPLRISCPTCRAPAGTPCVNPLVEGQRMPRPCQMRTEASEGKR